MMSDDLNPLATRVVTALARAHPEFAANSRPLGDGDVELFIEAGEDSNAGALVVSTARGGAIWIRFASPHMFYCVDDEAELNAVIEALLDERVLFVCTVGPHGEWAGTTLMDRGGHVDLEPGEKATALSWSGRFDQEFVSGTPGTSWVEFHDSELLAMQAVGADVEARLDAYVHAWDDSVQPPRGTGFVQRVHITLTEFARAHDRRSATGLAGWRCDRHRTGESANTGNSPRARAIAVHGSTIRHVATRVGNGTHR